MRRLTEAALVWDDPVRLGVGAVDRRGAEAASQVEAAALVQEPTPRGAGAVAGLAGAVGAASGGR
jgi:hypothetical protein